MYIVFSIYHLYVSDLQTPSFTPSIIRKVSLATGSVTTLVPTSASLGQVTPLLYGRRDHLLGQRELQRLMSRGSARADPQPERAEGPIGAPEGRDAARLEGPREGVEEGA